MRVKALIWREEDMYVAKELVTGVTSQGKSVEEALKNLREALELYLEEVPDVLERLKGLDKNIIGVMEIEAKAPKVIRA
jgi:predicted RNase H-like HicB family nuclease